jgi:hypothetical protein
VRLSLPRPDFGEFGLELAEPTIQPGAVQQLVVAAHFDDAAVLEDDDLVSVESRCAMANVVRFETSLSRACWISTSVSVSTDEVASSRIRMRGFFRTARAMETRWRSPPERSWPRSPTRVS